MKTKFSEFLTLSKDKFLGLPLLYRLLGIGLVAAIGLVTFFYMGGGDEAARAQRSNGSRSKAFRGQSTTVDPVPNRENLFKKLESSAGENTQTTNKIRLIIDGLEKQIVSVINGENPAKPLWLNDNFAGAGIDSARFQERFSDNQISVKRWQTAPTAPLFKQNFNQNIVQDVGGGLTGTQVSNSNAFNKFLKNALASWVGSSDFRIDLKLYETNFESERIMAKLVAEAFGQPGKDAGVQSTAIWKTYWSKVNGELTLENIQVQAHEEISAMIPGGQLFKDCTSSILKRCDSLPNQLIYGLDQWSRRIPGIDIVGNHGVAVGDINSDGLDDIYVCQPNGLPNVLLIQNPDGTAENAALASNLDVLDETHAALIVDIDNDKDQDIVLSTDENLILMSNKGDGTFQLEHKMPIGRDAHSISASDFDRDGDLDLFLCKYKDINRQSEVLLFPRNLETADDGGRNILLRNDEGWNFVDATEQSGITGDNTFFSRSAVWVDYDFDGDSDLYIANEFAADQLYENQEGWFTDISDEVGIEVAARHRSVSVGEFNQDGRFDFFVATDVPLSALRELKGSKSSKESRSQFQNSLTGENQIWFTAKPGEKLVPFFLRAPIFSSESAFASVTADLNNDGLDDVVVTNGFLSRSSSQQVDELFFKTAFSRDGETGDRETGGGNREQESQLLRAAHDVSELCRSGYSFGSEQRNRCYLSIGKLGFANLSAVSGVDLPDDARGVATTDWDNDGDPDLVMTCRGGPQIRIFRNQLQSQNNFVHFDLIGTESNVDAIGARVDLYIEGRKAPLIKMVQAGTGNLSQSTKRVMFGLGQTEKIKMVEVFWPSGKKQTFEDVSVDTKYELVEGAANLSEKINERFNLEIPAGSLEGLASLPKATERAAFYPPMPIPKLQFQIGKDDWREIAPESSKPLLAVFYSQNSESEKVLASFASAEAEAFDDLKCVGVMVGKDDDEKNLFMAQQVAEKTAFPFPFGSAAESTVEKLSILNGEWFNDHRTPATPFAILLDEKGKICTFYPSSSLDLEKIADEGSRVAANTWSPKSESRPLGGKWLAKYRTPKLNRLKGRLEEIGYPGDAEILGKQSLSRTAYELCQKAIELESQGEYVVSQNFFDKAIYADPKCVMAHVGRGHLLRRMSKQQKIGDDSVRVPLQQKAISDFEQALMLDPMNTEAIIGRANMAIDQNRLSDALTQLTDYVEVDPERYEIHAIIGRLLFFQKRYSESAKFLITAFENRPSLPFVAGDLGFLYLSAGEYEQAQKFLALALRLQPSNKNMVRLLAEAEFITGRFDEAVVLFERVTKLEPSRRRAKNVLAWLLATCPYENHRDGKRAMAIMNPVVELVGDKSPSTLEIYAACFAELGNFEKALALQQQAVNTVDAHNALEYYSDEQVNGMRSRLELYRRKRPYRMADLAQIPISPPGQKQD